MEITRTRLQEVTETVDIICNKCGKSCMRDRDFCGVYISYFGGYESGIGKGNTSKIRDGDSIEMSLCENCLSDLVESCVLQPSFEMIDYGGKGKIQALLNQVHQASEKELSVFLTDTHEEVRNYAKIRLQQIKEKK